MSLCKICLNASGHVHDWIGRRPDLQEESITDWLLDNIATQTNQIAYHPFNKHEEGTVSGADWDWWVLFGTSCFKLRIQAKRSRPAYDHYKDIAHANKSGLQIELLINSSAAANFYPMYAFYGHSCGTERCNAEPDRSGAYITSALDVYRTVIAVPRRKITNDDLHGLCIPFHCLFCCPLVRGHHGGPHGGELSELFRHYFHYPEQPGDEEPALLRAESQTPGYEADTPPMILALLENQEPGQVGDMLVEYRAMFPHSTGLVITRYQDRED